MKRKLQVGLVGYGKSAGIFHAPLLHAHNNFQIKKVLERHAQRSKEKYKEVEVVKNLEDLLDDQDIDLIVITTPNQFHFPIAQFALHAGKHVIAEKPFTVTSSEAKELVQLAKEKKKIISVFQNRRWDSDFLTIKKILKEGILGKLIEYEAHFDRFRSEIKDAWKEKELPGSGILYDLGSHLIDQSIDLFGLPQKVYADLRRQRESTIVDDNFEVILFYEQLKVTLKASMFVKGKALKCKLTGTKGSFTKYGLDVQEDALKAGNIPGTDGWGMEKEQDWGIINSHFNGLEINGKIESIPGDYMSYYSNVYEAIVEGKPLMVKPEISMNVIRIIEAAIESSKQQRVIELNGNNKD